MGDRRRHFHVVQIPRLRAVGLSALVVLVLLHNALILNDLAWPPLLLFAAATEGCVMVGALAALPSVPGPGHRARRRRSARPLRVLLVEDNPANREVAVRFLRRWGHTVVVASTGRAALDALDRERVDVVLMDIQMPEMDGYQATAAIRARERASVEHLPIIALTANAMKGDRERCLEAGMDGYVAKPIDARELFETIERIGAPSASPATAGLPPPSPAPGLDRAAVLARFEDDAELARVTIEACLDEYRGLTAEIGRALGGNDATAVGRGAHRLKGSVGHFSATAAELAARLERIARTGDLSGADVTWAQLAEHLDRLDIALRALLPELA